MLLASGTSIPTLPTIPTIAGAIDEEYEVQSESNSARYDDYATDEHTDHTDLASELDIDESEYRRELLNDVRIFFNCKILILMIYSFWAIIIIVLKSQSWKNFYNKFCYLLKKEKKKN